MERKVIYFEKPGPHNTETCIKIVKENIEKYKDVVVATTTGKTGVMFAEALKGSDVNLVAVTHSAGFREPSGIEIEEENLKRMQELGVKIYTGTILTHSLETSLMNKHQGIYPTYIITQTLRRFCEGIKVAVEIVMEACDGGLIEENREVIAVGGTARGADTVAIIKSKASKRFLELRVLEILAKPR